MKLVLSFILLLFLLPLIIAVDYSQIKDADSKMYYHCNYPQYGTDFCYRINFEKYFNSLQNEPIEGNSIYYEPSIFISVIANNSSLSTRFVLIYYFIKPSGEATDISQIYFYDVNISEGKSFYTNNLIKVPSDYPGIWGLRTVLVSGGYWSSILFRKNISELIRDLPFDTERINLSSKSEIRMETISWCTLITSILCALVSIISLIKDFRNKKSSKKIPEQTLEEILQKN